MFSSESESERERERERDVSRKQALTLRAAYDVRWTMYGVRHMNQNARSLWSLEDVAADWLQKRSQRGSPKGFGLSGR